MLKAGTIPELSSTLGLADFLNFWLLKLHCSDIHEGKERARDQTHFPFFALSEVSGHITKVLPYMEFPRWSSGQDSALPMQGAWVQSLVRELNPTCHN